MKKIALTLALTTLLYRGMHAEIIDPISIDAENKSTISDELLAVASQVMSQVSPQTQSSISSFISHAVGSVAQDLLSTAQNAFGNVAFTNNVTIGDQPTDLLTVISHAQFNGPVVLNNDVTNNGRVDGAYIFSNAITAPLTTMAPLCTLTFAGPSQSAHVQLTLICAEGCYVRSIFIVSNNAAGCYDVKIMDGGTAGPSLKLGYTSTAANAITINGAMSAAVSQGILRVEVLPNAASTVNSIA